MPHDLSTNATATLQHARSADSIGLEFDWSNHELTTECWCNPDVVETLSFTDNGEVVDPECRVALHRTYCREE